MKKIISILFIILVLAALVVPCFATINGNVVSWFPYPIDRSSNGNIASADYQAGTYYSYSSMVQYCFGNNTNYNYPVSFPPDGLVNDFMFSATFEFPGHLSYGFGSTSPFSKYFGMPGRTTSSVNAYMITFPNGGNNSNGAAYSYSTWDTIVGNVGDALICQFEPYTKSYNSHLFSGTTCGERSLNGTPIDGFSVYLPTGTNINVELIGQLYYTVDNSFYSISVNKAVELPTNASFAPNPYYINQITNYDYYYFDGHILIKSDTTSITQVKIAYDLSKQHFVDAYFGDLDTQDIIEENYTASPPARIFGEITKIAFNPGTPLYPPLNLTITENGTFPVNGTYNGGSIVVNVPTSTIPPDVSEGDIININSNGNYDVSEYDYARVNVPQETYETPSMFGWLIDSVQAFLNIEFADGVTPGVIILFIAGLALLIWILKIFLGG